MAALVHFGALVGSYGHRLAAHAEGLRRKVVSRARRAVSVGPMVGGAGIVDFAAGELDGLITFGLGLFVFQPELPSPERVKAMVKERVKELAMKAALTGRRPTREELEQIKDEVLAELRLETPPKTRPKPRFAFGLEGGWQPRGEAWQARLFGAFGLGPITIGPTTAVVHAPGSTSATAGVEAGLTFLLGKGPRPLGLQIFARGDFFVARRDTFADTGALGLRLLVDLL